MSDRKLSLLALLCTGLLSGCYLVSNAWHHNELFNSRRHIGEVMADPATNAEVRIRLAEVNKLMAYAKDIGLNTEGAYRYYIDNPGRVVSYLVQAAYPDRLQAITWWFPVVGRVPYLGFFARDDRDREAKMLRDQGYDVDLGAAGAFSSLGWFEDPIFSSMLQRHHTDLAHLFFHELTHRTLWIPGSTAFNENLAEFVAESISVRYLSQSGDLAGLRRYRDKRLDRLDFHDWLKRLKATLQQHYKQRQGMTRAALLQGKADIFREFTGPGRPQSRVVDYVGSDPWNNATVLASGLYAPDMTRFYKARACQGEATPWPEFFAKLQQAWTEVGDPFVALDSLCRVQAADGRASP